MGTALEKARLVGDDGAADASTTSQNEADLAKKSSILQMMQELRSEATMGHKLSDVRLWIAGALTALLEVDAGRAAYMKVRGRKAADRHHSTRPELRGWCSRAGGRVSTRLQQLL